MSMRYAAIFGFSETVAMTGGGNVCMGNDNQWWRGNWWRLDRRLFRTPLPASGTPDV